MIAFVLSGGASLGAIQAGMLETLYERGVRPDLIVGTSAGALNGAFIASREPSRATAREPADVWRTTSHAAATRARNPRPRRPRAAHRAAAALPDRRHADRLDRADRLIVLYGLGRLVMFFWRRDSEMLALGLVTSQWISLALMAAGALGFLASRRRPTGAAARRA